MPKIYFDIHSDLKDVVPHPVPASKMMPDWYKKMPNFRDNQNRKTETLKKCMPLRDMLTSGYIIPMWSGLRLKFDGKETHDFSRVRNDFNMGLGAHPFVQFAGTPLESFANGDHLIKLNSPWVIQTPSGYSTLFLAPQYRENSIEILPAIVDTDKYYHPINFPAVMIKKECEVEQGEPIVQAIPFKRQSWVSAVRSLNVKKAAKQDLRLLTRLASSYTSEGWIRKIFR